VSLLSCQLVAMDGLKILVFLRGGASRLRSKADMGVTDVWLSFAIPVVQVEYVGEKVSVKV